MNKPLRILITEDSEEDTLLIVRELRKEGLNPTFERVDTPEGLNAAFDKQSWDVVLSDYVMPHFSGLAALKIVQERGLELPFIVVSGKIGEDTAIEAMKAGAHDYVFKSNLKRLAPSIKRELQEAEVRRERKQAEEALRESEERYRKLVTSVTDYIYTVKVENGRSVKTTHGLGCVSVTGYTTEEYEANPNLWYKMIYEEDKKAVLEQAEKVLSGKRVPPLEHRIIHKNGSIRWIMNTPVARYSEKGQIVAYDGLIADVTERKGAEETLRASREYAKNIIDSSTDIIIAVDKERKITEFNLAAQETFGYSKEEILGKHIDLLYSDPTQGLKVHETTLLNGRHIQEITNKRKNGEFFPSFLSASVLRDARGEVVGVMGVSRDITERVREEAERKRAEEALIDSEERFKILFEYAPDAYYLHDLEGNLVDGNIAAEELSGYKGYKREELVGKNLLKLGLLSSDQIPKATALLAKNAQGLPTGPEEFVLSRKDGTEVSVEVRSLPVKIKGQTLVLGIARDLTERKRLEEQLIQSQKMEAIGRLAGGIAHDFNNMLTAIKGNAQLLKESLPPESQEMELMEEILEASDKAAGLSRHLLTFSRREPVKPRVLQINEVVLNLEKMLRRIIGEDIELVITPGKEVGLLKGDPRQIEQVLLNLALNAKDAMPKGGKLIIRTENASLDELYAQSRLEVTPGNYVLVSVTDTGVGMSGEVKKHLFEPFFTTKETGKGTGLGLSVVYGIIKQHKGHISVYSEPEEGTTFRIYLPRLEEREEKEEETTSLKAKETPSSGGKETILIVENDLSVRKFVSKTLEKLGYRVLEVSKPEETLEVLEKERGLKVDLLLTDVIMPKMSGKELAEKIKNLYPKLKVIFMSGYTKDHLKFQDLLGKDFDFLEKPFTVENLAKKLREVLER